MGAAKPDYGRMAANYDRLRPIDENWWELFEAIVEAGDLAGRRVLDVGCGTGRVAAALNERGTKVWAVDPSPEMLERARANVGRSVRLKRAPAETLPFKDGWFDRALLRLVVHVVDRPRAFAELFRVLQPGGRIVIATFAPEYFEGFWLYRLVPGLEEVDRPRMAGPATLCEELLGAGFGDPVDRRLRQTVRIDREEALARIRGRYISGLTMLDDEAIERAVARAERELGEEVEYEVHWAIVTATRPRVDAVRRRS